MKVLVFSPAAEMDLEHIWDHSVEIWGLDQADRYLDEIRDACLVWLPVTGEAGRSMCVPGI